MSANKRIFKRTRIKLTLVYLSILMIISLMFSLILFEISENEIKRSLNKPISQRQRALLVFPDDKTFKLYKDQQASDYEYATNRLKSNLVLVNLAILLLGGLASYYLAERTLKPIEEAHEAQGRFTSDASHELRTPIAAMRLENEIALAGKMSQSEVKKLLESNIEELDKLTVLSEGLLELSRLENSEIQKSNVALKHIIDQAEEEITPTLKSKKQSLKVDKIPALTINVNQSYIERALIILIDNASKYSPEKSDIRLKINKTNKFVELSVVDKGVGINKVDLPFIFDRFYRADVSRTRDSAHGYGIGLSIAKTIVELHEGKIEAKSTLNKGSTFTITLPL